MVDPAFPSKIIGSLGILILKLLPLPQINDQPTSQAQPTNQTKKRPNKPTKPNQLTQATNPTPNQVHFTSSTPENSELRFLQLISQVLQLSHLRGRKQGHPYHQSFLKAVFRGHYFTKPNNALLLMAEIPHQFIGSLSHYF